MSYLNPLRLHFAGRFQAAISTVNNRAQFYNNDIFRPEFQNPGNTLGLFNPRGSADWRLIGCNVTAAWMANGSVAPANDAIRTYLIADADQRAAAKLVDLDPQQQIVSEIWGLEVRICDVQGTTLLRSQYEPAAFIDIWTRTSSGGGDNAAGAMYQSVLTDLEWGNLDGSPFLQQLRASATDGLLSIKFNVDGINLNAQSDEFMRGRIVGTIGPANADEPHHFVLGRQFMTTGAPSRSFFVPSEQINFCVAAVNQEMGKIYLDLGNALPIDGTITSRPPQDIGALALVYFVPQQNVDPLVRVIDMIPYTQPNWYRNTAGIVELPAHRRLTPQELAEISVLPLSLALSTPEQGSRIAIQEHASGLFLRADGFVFRLNPGEAATVRLIATQFGERLPDARILSIYDTAQLQGSTSPLASIPVARPIEAIEFPLFLVTDSNGEATMPILAKNPGNPRRFIDGQVYGVRPYLEETLEGGIGYAFNDGNFISLLVWSDFQADEPPTWHGSMQPIFKQYANLYPVMQQFVDMGDYEAVCNNRKLMLLAFGLDVSHPNSMPVTRDLSSARRRTILRWLTETGADGKPLLGTPPPGGGLAEVAEESLAPEAAPTEADIEQIVEGGKASAMRRRRGVQPFLTNLGN
jgi:hypothetical protein